VLFHEASVPQQEKKNVFTNIEKPFRRIMEQYSVESSFYTRQIILNDNKKREEFIAIKEDPDNVPL